MKHKANHSESQSTQRYEREKKRVHGWWWVFSCQKLFHGAPGIRRNSILLLALCCVKPEVLCKVTTFISHMNSLVFACLCFTSKYCVCVYQEISSCGWKYVYFPHTFEGFFCKWKMEPGVGRKPEHREGSPTGFGIEKKMWRVQPASLFSQASQSISIGTADTPPFFWPGTSKKIAEISKAKQKKHIHFQLQRSPPLKFKFPTPFPYNLIEVRLPILADLQRHTPSIFFVNFLGVKRNFQPKIRAEKGRVYVPKTLHCLSEMGKGMFPKDVNIAIIWDLDMSKNSEW